MKHLLYLSIVCTLVSCGSDTKNSETDNFHNQFQHNSKDRIANLEAIVYSDTVRVLNVPLALELAALYSHKAKENPLHSVSADLLFKAGELYMNSNRGNKAIVAFKEVHIRFPGSKRSSTARFLKAFVAETILGDEDLAKRFYQEFLTAHPNHDLADDAQMSINLLGLNDEELLERLKGEDEI